MLSGLWLGLGIRRRWLQTWNSQKAQPWKVFYKRGELRIGLEVGYMPFEMIDKRSGLRQKEIRHGGPDARAVNSA
jgi:hypothetical protein